MDLSSKNRDDAATDLGLDQMTLKDNTAVEMNIEELEKVKAGSYELKTMEAAGMSKDGTPR